MLSLGYMVILEWELRLLLLQIHRRRIILPELFINPAKNDEIIHCRFWTRSLYFNVTRFLKNQIFYSEWFYNMANLACLTKLRNFLIFGANAKIRVRSTWPKYRIVSWSTKKILWCYPSIYTENNRVLNKLAIFQESLSHLLPSRLVNLPQLGISRFMSVEME